MKVKSITIETIHHSMTFSGHCNGSCHLDQHGGHWPECQGASLHHHYGRRDKGPYNRLLSAVDRNDSRSQVFLDKMSGFGRLVSERSEMHFSISSHSSCWGQSDFEPIFIVFYEAISHWSKTLSFIWYFIICFIDKNILEPEQSTRQTEEDKK